MQILKKHMEEYPDAYQYERAAFFEVSTNCILYTLRRLDISRKSLIHPNADWRTRADFMAQLYKYETVQQRTIIYIDESGFL
ncbi:MAG: IS630 transposase-related protein [Chryseobacterium taeanense]